MNKLRPRNKICFQNNKHIHANLNIDKLNKKKWILFKKNIFWSEKNKIKLIKRLKIFKNLTKILKKPFEYKKIFKKFSKSKKPPKKKLYKERLFAKQQLKNFYGCIPEYQLKNLFKKLKSKKNNNNIIQKFIILLESRLDMVIYRSKIVKTIFEAKQIINHGKIKVNNKIINSSNFILNRGDIISLNNFKIIKKYYYMQRKKNNKFIIYKKKRKNKVNYIEINDKLNICIFLRKPLFNEIKYPFELNLKLVDEYLKKN